jgi:DNA-binding transcriptional ArsR family regulator
MMAFGALRDPTRIHIVEMLAASGQMPVHEIGRHFSITPPAISQHLKTLREANLVSVEVRAQQRLYSLNPAGIGEIEDWVSKVREMWMQSFDALDDLLKQETKKHKKKKRSRR